MITLTMSFKEIFDNLRSETNKIEFRKESLRPKAMKCLKNARTFPAYAIYTYDIPSSHNSYVIYFYAESRFKINNPDVDSFSIVVDDRNRYMIKWGATGYKHTPDSPIKGIRQIIAYTNHFAKRYNERFLKDKTLSTNEIMCRYLSRNKYAMPIKLNEEINKNYKKYGEFGTYAFVIRDGFCFCESITQGVADREGDRNKDKPNAIGIIYKTFLTKTELLENQELAINQEHIDGWKRYFEDFTKQAKDGVLTLSLDK